MIMRHQEKKTIGLVILLFLFHLIGGCVPYQARY